MGILHDGALQAVLPLAQQFGILDLFAVDVQRMHGSGLGRSSGRTMTDALRTRLAIFGTCPTCLALVESSRWQAHHDWHAAEPRFPRDAAATETVEDREPIELGPVR